MPYPGGMTRMAACRARTAGSWIGQSFGGKYQVPFANLHAFCGSDFPPTGVNVPVALSTFLLPLDDSSSSVMWVRDSRNAYWLPGSLQSVVLQKSASRLVVHVSPPFVDRGLSAQCSTRWAFSPAHPTHAARTVHTTCI